MIEIDGSYESGGGQIVRTALGLSVFTGKAFRVKNIRMGKKDAGLKKQHVEAIKALKKLSNSKAEGDNIGSLELTFYPGKYKGGKLEIDIETAGSITLLLQSLIVPMIFCGKRTNLTIKGGTDVAWSMPTDYFKHVFLPHVNKYADVSFKIIKRGYYPKGNGVIEFSVNPKDNRQQIILAEQGKMLYVKGVANASLSLQKKQVAEKLASYAKMHMQKLECPIDIEVQYSDSLSDGAGLVIWSLHSDSDEMDYNNPVILGADVLGEIHKPSEDIARECTIKLVEEIGSGAAVDKNLADNLIPLLGIVGGKIKTSEITKHTLANIYVTEKFLDVKFDVNKKEIAVVKR